MGLGEAVSGKGRHQLPDALPGLGRHAGVAFGGGDEFLLKLLHLPARVKMAHGPPQQVGFGQAETGQAVCDAQHLLLVENYPVGFVQEGCQGRMQMNHGFFPFKTAHEGIS